MITVKNINGSPERSGKEIYAEIFAAHGKCFGSSSDENNFYFFESEKEQIDYLAAIEAENIQVEPEKSDFDKKLDQIKNDLLIVSGKVEVLEKK